MQSMLIVSPDKKQREDYALKLCRENQIDRFDISAVVPEQTLGIEEVRNMRKKIFLKPFKSRQKAVILYDAHTATLETQNALLKILEEPPANTFVILTAENENTFLPTVISRCKIIKLTDNQSELSKEDLLSIQKEFADLLNSGPGYKLKFAQDLAKDKDKAKTWLKNVIKAERFNLLEEINRSGQNNRYLGLLKSLHTAYKTIETTNVNLRFMLENTFLNF